MSTWNWHRTTPRNPEPHDYTGFAPHLRGRVHRGAGGWWTEVVNTHTGTVINRDGPSPTLSEAFRDVEARTHSARGAWMFGYGRKSVAR